MKNLVSDAILAAIANPAACDLEVIRSDLGVVGTANIVESAIKAAGASVVNRYDSGQSHRRFSPPDWDCVVFRARPEGYARRRDRFVLVPALQAVVSRDEDGAVWVRFQRADRPFAAQIHSNAA